VEGGAGVTADRLPRPAGGLSAVQASCLGGKAEVVHAFSTRLGGVSRPPFASLNLGQSVGDDPAAVLENRRRFFGAFGVEPRRMVRVRQVHGDGVLVVDEALARRPGFPACLAEEPVEADALITRLPGLALVVSTADCVPILIHDPVRSAVAAVHAGWRGTARRVSAATVAAMVERFGTVPADCRAAIGPSIRGCCYEVDGPVVEAVGGSIPGWEAQAAESGPGHWRLDLAGLNRMLLESAGLTPERIEVPDLCTACRREAFFSHRAEHGKTGRMMSFILLTGDTGKG
jgi:polyphenol oxidase